MSFQRRKLCWGGQWEAEVFCPKIPVCESLKCQWEQEQNFVTLASELAERAAMWEMPA